MKGFDGYRYFSNPASASYKADAIARERRASPLATESATMTGCVIISR